MRAMTKSESKRRVAELKAAGCKVKKVKVRGGTVVLKKCPSFLGELLGTGGEPVPKWLAGGLALTGALVVFNLVKTADTRAS